MKKSWYMFLLIVCALVLGGILADHASGSWSWLGEGGGFKIDPATFSITNVISVTFGFNFYISVAQVIMLITAFVVYSKTSGKICG
ncbi:MAG: DUF4321 domain-containing protein [Ruminococcus sp.]|nr:DUF4321 domain-containing protein [Ruminococcus sp.]